VPELKGRVTLQVHAARLKGGGKDVVLKVLKPGVEDTLLTDLNFLYLAGKFLQIISPELERTSLVGIIEDIRSSMLDEVCNRHSRVTACGSGARDTPPPQKDVFSCAPEDAP
jgi:hypothetical protein